MPKIKLKEWADRNNLSYITANRHFHAGLIPNATQLNSGTILVEDDILEQTMANTTGTNDAMSTFLKKTVEFSKNNATVEDFAAYVISNFQLKLNGQTDVPRYSKNKPKSEEVQKHFKQFLPDKEKEEQLKAIKNVLKEQKLPTDATPFINAFNEELAPFSRTVDADGTFLGYEDMASAFSSVSPTISAIHTYGPQITTESLVTRSVDFDTTPQQINYTGSNTNQTFSSSYSPNITNTSGEISNSLGSTEIYFNSSPLVVTNSPFLPTQKELLSSTQVIETVEAESAPRKRGRKPTIKK
jgi:hypothetical protein